jgi:hypothetical protein
MHEVPGCLLISIILVTVTSENRDGAIYVYEVLRVMLYTVGTDFVTTVVQQCYEHMV